MHLQALQFFLLLKKFWNWICFREEGDAHDCALCLLRLLWNCCNFLLLNNLVLHVKHARCLQILQQKNCLFSQMDKLKKRWSWSLLLLSVFDEEIYVYMHIMHHDAHISVETLIQYITQLNMFSYLSWKIWLSVNILDLHVNVLMLILLWGLEFACDNRLGFGKLAPTIPFVGLSCETNWF